MRAYLGCDSREGILLTMERQYVPHTIKPSIRLSSLSLTSPLPFLPFPTPPAPSDEGHLEYHNRATERAAPHDAVLNEVRTLLAAAAGPYS